MTSELAEPADASSAEQTIGRGLGMKQAPKNGNGRTAGDSRRADRDERGMSAAMRQLILSFGKLDSEPPWNPDAYARGPKQAQ